MNHFSFDELEIGLSRSFEVSITETMMHAFAALTGDVNPLHTDAGYALRSGFRGPVVYGLLTASFYSTLVGVHLPGELALLHGIDVAFSKPVFVGDRLEVSGEVRHKNVAYRQIELKSRIVRLNSDAGPVSRATIKLGVRATEPELG